ncbi:MULTISPECIES: hypothetical protein [Methylomicrobium]|uniref:Uncharacterized protein n=1 Tax=Methylomicrobium album BG8 TaxID=686340 RepID=H8GFW8_METAL|nr:MULTISPECIES: hypothetical protein [Methylomicrobium]EIC28719.1 hypothetical protein Metal_0895 [Methylomicrobium album BG8]
MSLLQSITTEYDDVEDRIKLVGKFRNGDLIVMWITQRLFSRLLPVLLDRLQAATGNLQQVGQVGSVVQEFAQQAARAQMKPQPPLKPESGAQAWLVKSIDVAATPNGLRLTFKSGDSGRAVLKLEGQFLRQWLNILYDINRKAGWPLSQWPDWVRESARAVPKRVVKH